MNHSPGLAAIARIGGNDRLLVRANDVLIAHHRLLHLVGYIAAAAATHAVRKPRKAGRVEKAVVVVLQREIPIFDKCHVQPGVDTAKVRHDGLACRIGVASIAVGIAAHAYHPPPVGEAGNIGTNFEIDARQSSVESVLTHHKILIKI